MSAAPETIESIAHLDFNPPCSIVVQRGATVLGKWIPYEAKASPCGKPAAFAIKCRKCGAVGWTCAEHAATIAATTAGVCSGCKAVGPGIVLFEFIPLGAHS